MDIDSSEKGQAMTDSKEETEAVTALVLQLRNDQAMGVNSIAAALGVGSGRVARILEEAGLRKEKRTPDADLEQRAIALRREGHSAAEVARQIGWSEATVKRALKRAGLSGWEAQRKILSERDDPLTPEIIRLYHEQQLPVVKVAAQLGVRKSRVSRVAQKAGVYREADVMTDAEKDQIVALRREELTMPEIALRVRRSQAAVREHLEKLGLNDRIRRPIRIEGDIAYVPLTRGKEAIIDAADVPLIEGRSWSATKIKRGSGVIEYYASSGGNHSHSLMHRVIAGNPVGRVVDHDDHDGLNNRRKNLIVTDHSGNAHNARRRMDTGFPRGVKPTKSGRGYYGEVTLSTGIFATPEEAAEARRLIIEKVRGSEIRITEKVMPIAVDVDPDTGEILDG